MPPTSLSCRNCCAPGRPPYENEVVKKWTAENRPGSNRIIVQHKIGHSDLAAMTGIAHENLSRILKDWERRKIVSRLSGYYCLENKSKLEREVQQL